MNNLIKELEKNMNFKFTEVETILKSEIQTRMRVNYRNYIRN